LHQRVNLFIHIQKPIYAAIFYRFISIGRIWRQALDEDLNGGKKPNP